MTKIIYEPHPVTPDRKAELKAMRVRVIDVKFKPKSPDEAEGVVLAVDDFDDGNIGDHDKIELGTDSGDGFSNEQLHDAIELATGERMHHKTGREKLIATFNELNAQQ